MKTAEEVWWLVEDAKANRASWLDVFAELVDARGVCEVCDDRCEGSICARCLHVEEPYG